MIESPKLLSERGLFEFDPVAVYEISHGFQPVDHPDGPIVEELVALTAAEYALAPLFGLSRPVLPVERPFRVGHGDALLALLKTDCGLTFCLDRLAEVKRLTLADITAFSSDIAKLDAVGVSIEQPPDEIGDIARAVDALESAHRKSPVVRGQRFGTSGFLRLQGFLWAVKLSVPAGNLEQAIGNAYEAFELTSPVWGSPVPA